MSTLPEDTVFVVTGFARSGTTYMMRCLEAGGIKVVSRSWRYELRGPDFGMDLKPYAGKCIKYFAFGLKKCDVSNCAILFMKRDPIKIVVSCIRFGAKIHPWVANWTLLFNRNNEPRGWKLDTSPYEEERKVCARLWEQHSLAYSECQLEEMNTYEKRLKFFRRLVALGWPVDPEKAASVDNDEPKRIEEKGRKVAWT
jgi:hypothetical protein